MKADEILQRMSDAALLDKVYRFAYRRCDSSCEAEDLCQDILLTLLSAAKKQTEIANFYGFVWMVAHRVYADHCEKRRRSFENSGGGIISIEGWSTDGFDQSTPFDIPDEENGIERLLDEAEEAELLSKIYRELSFLSAAYRKVMILYYLDGCKVQEIAARLGISESAVKQRLFSGRNSLRDKMNEKKEIAAMNQNLTLKPMEFSFIGTGNPVGNDPREVAQRRLSKNIIYLCKDKAKTAGELSEALGVPMPYVEEELEIQCLGMNGSYGNLRKTENGRYISNILVVDHDEFAKGSRLIDPYLPQICDAMKKAVEKSREKLLSFPYESAQTELQYVSWRPIISAVWRLEGSISKKIRDGHFADIKLPERPFTSCAIAEEEGSAAENPPDAFLGCDGIGAAGLCGYTKVHLTNFYSYNTDVIAMDVHFHCGHNIAEDEKIQMLLRSVGGLSVDTLSEEEKEIAAKAIECGYIRRNGDMLEPKIVVVDGKQHVAYDALIDAALPEKLLDEIAGKIAEYVKAHIPAHLMCEYERYASLLWDPILVSIIEECVKEGLLASPEQRIGGEGVILTVIK